MEIGIIGFQKTGKTTVFNALTGQEAKVSAFSSGKTEPNLAVVPVPDTRLDKLTEMHQPKKHTPAVVHYIDLAGIVRGHGESEGGLGETQLHAISQCDALMAVIRGFDNASGEKPEIASETEAIILEMVLRDLEKVETRLERLSKSRGKITGNEAKLCAIEEGALERIKPQLEEGRPVRAVELSEDEDKLLRGFQFLTGKPLMIVVNAPEDALASQSNPTAEIDALGEAPGVCVTWIAGRSEMDIASLPSEERADFFAEYGIEEPAASRIIRLSYDLLGLMSFFTVGDDECRAWTVRCGAAAPEAAGAVHSDLQRGFIRAEVCRWDELLEAGSRGELKKQGKLHLEGKNYEVCDGDVVNILFSV